MKRILLFGAVSSLLLGLIGATFWYQELQYLLPTPVPKGYRIVSPGELVAFNEQLLPQQHKKPIVLHFFSPSCPCSRFNLRHFAALYKTYRNRIDFFAVTPDAQDIEKARGYLPEGITVIHDKDDRLAQACGVYSTPQAAIIRTDNTLFFRGNYNRSRYCTDKATNYVEQALVSLINNRPLPAFDSLATISYGCALSQ
ncbi:TlpA family protein disulfide reductase [Rhodoflexus sp.]